MMRRIFCILALALVTTAAFAHEGSLPLGDGKLSTSPQAGFVYSCQQQFGGGGAFRDGSWISGSLWYPDKKLHVQGDVAWPNTQISISAENGQRVIRANNLPDHNTGTFPVQQSDPAFQYDRNPNTIREQQILLTLPLEPQAAAQPSCVGMGMIGFSLSGAAIFNALDGAGRDAAAHEIQDKCNGHPEMQGQYHYHSYSPCMKEEGGEKGGASGLIGYALDGFGIYGPYGAGGKEITNADLDACHGRTSPVLWNGKMQNVYHYHMTFEYPYSIGCYKGTPVSGRLQQQAGGGGRGPPDDDKRQRMERAAQTLGVDVETLRQAVGPPPPDFAGAAQQLGIPEDKIRAAFGR